MEEEIVYVLASAFELSNISFVFNLHLLSQHNKPTKFVCVKTNIEIDLLN